MTRSESNSRAEKTSNATVSKTRKMLVTCDDTLAIMQGQNPRYRFEFHKYMIICVRDTVCAKPKCSFASVILVDFRFWSESCTSNTFADAVDRDELRASHGALKRPGADLRIHEVTQCIAERSKRHPTGYV